MNSSELQTKKASGDISSSAAAVKRSLGVKAALAALRIYKVYVSPWFAGTCRFEPTCSRYAYESIERFGVMHGMWLAAKRLLRCQPLSRKFGYDPVPEKNDAAPSHCGASAHEVHEGSAMSGEAHS